MRQHDVRNGCYDCQDLNKQLQDLMISVFLKRADVTVQRLGPGCKRSVFLGDEERMREPVEWECQLYGTPSRCTFRNATHQYRRGKLFRLWRSYMMAYKALRSTFQSQGIYRQTPIWFLDPAQHMALTFVECIIEYMTAKPLYL